MAVLALGLVGAGIGSAIGGTFLGMTAASIGWSVATTIGGVLLTPDSHTEGPRLGDLSVSASTYGTMIPVIYGAFRLAGNVIECTDKREVSNTQEQGKGGSQSSTSYTYNVDMAVSLCEGPIDAVRKIYSAGKLIYDASAGGDIGTTIASATNSAGFKFYSGTEDQLPDPTLEALHGVGNVPAYRGLAYMVFTHLDCPNGNIPQLTFEVAEIVDRAPEVYEYAPALNADSFYPTVSEKGVYRPQRSTGQVLFANPGFVTTAPRLAAATFGPLAVDPVSGGEAQYFGFDFSAGVSGEAKLYTQSAEDGSPQKLFARYVPGSDDYVYSAYRLYVDRITGAHLWGNDPNEFRPYPVIFPPTVGDFPIVCDTPWGGRAWGGLCMYNGTVYGQSIASNGNLSLQMWGSDGVYIAESVGLPLAGGTTLPLIYASLYPDASGIYMAIYQRQYFTAGTGILAIYHYTYDGAWRKLCEYHDLDDKYTPTAETRQIIMYANSEYAIIPMSGTTSKSTYLISYALADLIEPTLADVIESISTRAGADPAQIDVSGLADTVRGYGLSNVSTARSNIEPLLKCYFIDAAETDGVIRYRPRASLTPVATIGYDELATAESGNDTPDAFPMQRTQEAELPRSVSVSYINQDADYQQGTETARRIVTGSINDATDSLPVVASASRAATVAQALLYNAWNERDQRTMALSRRWAFLDAGDVVTVEYPRGTFSPKRIASMSDTGVLVNMGLVNMDGSIYTVTPPGATPPNAQDGVVLLPPARAEVLDIPILRDADNDAGVYVALNGMAEPWPGGTLYIGPDDASLVDRGAVSRGAPIGTARTLLGAAPAGIMDEASTVEVAIGPGELSSASRADVFDNGANAALIGSEIVQFTTAIPVGAQRWRLSGFLRGQRGTERHIAGHAIGERFVLLAGPGLLRPVFDLVELNAPRQFRAVTAGRSISTGVSITDVDTGEGLRPFDPVNLRRAPSGTATVFTWDRRTRSSVTFPQSGVDVPLFEATETYSVDIYSGSTVVRTISTTVPTFTYTAAQRAADSPTSMRIYQVSATVGRGHYLQGTP